MQQEKRSGFAQWHVRAFIAAMLLVVGACGGGGSSDDDSSGGGGGGSGPLTSIEISPESGAIARGGEATFYAIGKDSDGKVVADASFTWASSNTSIVTIDPASGVATGMAAGSATLTAASGSVSKSIEVHVVEPGQGKVAGGSSHACGLTKLGVAYCWGRNAYGQIGIDPYVQQFSATPVLVPGGHLFVDIEPAYQHTCALKADGTAWCWGLNFSGELGYTGSLGDYQWTETPVQVETDQRFVDLSAEFQQTCGLTAEGAVYCWPFAAEESYWTSSGYPLEQPSLPVLHSNGLVFTSIDVGSAHACGISESGAAYCWGAGSNNQLGTGTWTSYSVTPVAVAGGISFQSISAGLSHSCGLDTTGKAYCWGGGYEISVLGAGNLYDYDNRVPMAVATSASFTQIDAGGLRTLALDGAGNAWWWGSYDFSDCTLDDVMNGGSCTTYANEVFTPQQVYTYAETFTAIDAGGSFNVALSSDGEALGWLGNSNGELGLGYTSMFVSSPASASPGYSISVDDGAVVIAPGETAVLTVNVQRTGSFTVDGAGFSDPITLNVPYLPAGVTATFLPAVLGPTQDESLVLLSAAANAAPGRENITIQATADGAVNRSVNALVRIPLPDNGGPYTLVCDSLYTELPDGFHCMDNGYGNIAPGKYKYPDMWGWWVDSDTGLCMNLMDDGYAYSRFRAPQLGGGSTTVRGPNQWGVIVRSDGVPEGSATQWYLFVGSNDAQTALLGYDSAANQIVGWSFYKSSSCPW